VERGRTVANASGVTFFLERMESHNKVETCNRLNDEMEYLFEVTRKDGLPTLTVHLSDAYRYGSWEYLSHPRLIGKGDFILVAGFASVDGAVVEMARKDGIGVGKIGKLMGALNLERVWEYRSPEERSH
jgi:hypothetical protein